MDFDLRLAPGALAGLVAGILVGNPGWLEATGKLKPFNIDDNRHEDTGFEPIKPTARPTADAKP